MAQFYRLLTSCRIPGQPRDTLRGGQVVPEDEVAAQLQAIINQTGDESNRQNLCLLERALAVICLDEPLPPSFNYGSLRDQSNLQGHVVGAPEGVAVVQLLEWLLERSEGCGSSRPLPRPPTKTPQAMQWQMSPRLYRHIQDAAKNLDRLNQRLTATYESASTRRFRLGRVDCIRSASVEACAWADAMCQAEIADVEAEGRRVTFSVADEKRVSLFEAAVARQTQEMVDNILGQGIDIHLLGLRMAARDLGEPELPLFADE
ncbi:hypothetical protein B566_EDAN013694, partial [Ephemera danica]